jgi:hypothetical protein
MIYDTANHGREQTNTAFVDCLTARRIVSPSGVTF